MMCHCLDMLFLELWVFFVSVNHGGPTKCQRIYSQLKIRTVIIAQFESRQKPSFIKSRSSYRLFVNKLTSLYVNL